MSTTDTLAALHDHYVEAVNMAVAEGDDARVARLVAEFDLERADGCRKPRLRDLEQVGGAGEVTLLRHGDEVFELAQFHSVILSMNGACSRAATCRLFGPE